MAELKVEDVKNLTNEKLFEQLNSLVVGIEEFEIKETLDKFCTKGQTIAAWNEIEKKQGDNSYVIDWNKILGRDNAVKFLEDLIIGGYIEDINTERGTTGDSKDTGEEDLSEWDLTLPGEEDLSEYDLTLPGEDEKEPEADVPEKESEVEAPEKESEVEAPEAKPEVRESAKKKVKKLTEVAEMNEEQLVEKLGGNHAHVVNSVGESLRAAAQIALSKIGDRKIAIKQKAEEYRKELTSGVVTEIGEAKDKIDKLNKQMESIDKEMKAVEKEISGLDSKLKKNQNSINQQQGKVDKEEKAKEEIANNTQSMVKLEKNGMLKRAFSRFVEKFFSSPIDSLSRKDRADIIAGKLEMPKKKGIFLSAKEALKEEKESIAQNQEGDRKDGEKLEQKIQERLDKLKEKLEELGEKRKKLEGERFVAHANKTEKEGKYKKLDAELEDWKEEVDFLNAEKERIEEMSTGKLLVKRTLRDIKKAFGFGKEREVGEDR